MRARPVILALALIAAALPARAAPEVSAHFAAPTDRYGHGALGPEHEFAKLVVTVTRPGSGPSPTVERKSYTITAAPDMVFEDTAPRLADLDGDGFEEVIVVESSLTKGSRVAVFALATGAPTRIAATEFVGEPNHWLAPIGIADLDGNGEPDLALIDAPHRLGILRIYAFRDGALHQIYQGGRLSNHHYGASRILGGIRDCGSGPQMVVARFDWGRLYALRLSADGRVFQTDLGRDTSSAAFDAARACKI